MTTNDDKGDLLIYPGGDTSVPPSGRMPVSGYFFDTIIRQPPIDELYKPYYRKINDWIHSNTRWKTFKHSCGAIFDLIPKYDIYRIRHS